MTREKIENFREVILPFNRRVLLKIDYDGQGASDAEEFAKDFNEILNLAIKALEQESTTKNDLAVDAVSRKAVINQIFYSTDNSGDVVLGSALRKRIEKLPSVTPQLSSELEKNSKKLEKNFGELDCISREQAIDAFPDLLPNIGYSKKAITEVLQELPSVTPQESQSFKWCTDCREYDQEKHCCHRYSKVIRDAVAEIRQEPKFIAKSDGTIEQIKNCNDCLFKNEWEKIGKLLSVFLEKQTEQEPKTGEWIEQNDDYYDWYECSECGYGSEGEMLYSSEYDVRTNYCPNCGAKMVEPQESEKT